MEGRASGKPLELTDDGDLLIIIERMIHDDDMVAVGGVRVEDRVGNDLADRAADLGRRRVLDPVVDVRSRFLSACCSWYPVVFDLQRFFIAIARAAVNDDGHAGVVLHPTVWSSGVLLRFVRFVFLPGSLLGFLALLDFGGMGLLVGLLLRFVRMMLVFGHILLGCWLSSGLS